MGRENYDDMVENGRRRPQRSGGKVGLIAIFGVLICAIAVLLVLILSPVENQETQPQGQEPVTVEIRQPEIVTQEAEETSQPETADQETVSAASVQPAEADMSAAVSAAAGESAQSIRPSSTVAEAGRTRAVDLVSAQNLASFDTSDHLIYITHTVQEGEDLASIAQSYGRDVSTLISVNGIRNLAAVVPGVQLRIPNMDGQIYIVQNGDMLSTIARSFNPDLGWQTLMDVNGLTSENIRVGQELFIPALKASSDESLQSTGLSFSSPLDGTVYASFGQLFNGMSLDGVLISASAGSAVRAACAGVVVDAGRADSLGRFVSIQHDQGYKTYYYNLETVNVQIGGEVEEGQVIGAVGSSSTAFSRPTLYFIIEQGGIRLNPELFI